MGAMSPWHWAVVALVAIVLFGSKRLPDAARGLGRSLRIFKSEVKEMSNDDAQATTAQRDAHPQLPASTPVSESTPATESTHTEPKSA
ncbi:MAG: Sec-independent protein translocase subunit TatA [Rhodococcus sp.]|nr:Sec-independent protein translocase subunit TatA [Rhodococcus sp. (in: high G+C Gram-positive bacteria)]